jgi:acyl-CoA synthetase (AMP-forming)/AMP-acid ligase II
LTISAYFHPWFNRDQFVLEEGGYGRVVGRLKEMIIRDNTNIFPVEIEEFFMTHPEVMEVQVKQQHASVSCLTL